MISQNQILNKILATKDLSIVTLNNLTKDYFFDYKAEFDFIKSHKDTYGQVPDKLTFAKAFPKFDFVDVTEPDTYLIEQLYRDYNQAYLAKRFNNIKTLLENDKVEEATQYFLNSTENLKTGSVMTCTDLITDASRFDHYVERTTDTKKYYLTTGFPEYDFITGGIDRKNENMVIMARPGVGKSNLLLKIATAASMQGLTVGLYSGEMTADKVGYRIDAFLSGISNTAMNRGWLQIQQDYQRYIESLPKSGFGPIKVITPNDVPNGIVTVETLEAFVDQQKLDILLIDQYDLLEDLDYAKAEHERVGHIAKKIKALQVKKGIPIISVNQMNRQKNEDGSKDTTQAAGSDKISRYATTMIALEQKINEDKTMQLTLDIIKARDGGNGNKLVYRVNFDNGIFDYIGDSTDGVTSKQDIEKLQNSYAKVDDDGQVTAQVY